MQRIRAKLRTESMKDITGQIGGNDMRRKGILPEDGTIILPENRAGIPSEDNAADSVAAMAEKVTGFGAETGSGAEAEDTDETRTGSREVNRCYSVDDLQEILQISKPTIYSLLKRKEFRWFLIGGKYRISRKSFDEWFDGKTAAN